MSCFFVFRHEVFLTFAYSFNLIEPLLGLYCFDLIPGALLFRHVTASVADVGSNPRLADNTRYYLVSYLFQRASTVSFNYLISWRKSLTTSIGTCSRLEWSLVWRCMARETIDSGGLR